MRYRITPVNLAKAAHISQDWRIHELVPDFRLEDVWALPTPGGPDDFPLLVQGIASADPAERLPRRPHLVEGPICGVFHLGWVADETGVYHAQMAVYVKPNGRLGSAYMAAIKPFRYRIVYPQMMRELERRWSER